MHAEIARLTGEGLFTDEEIGTTCCFATQDKVWVTGPAGEKWEVYTVLADSETFGSSPQHLDDATPRAASAAVAASRLTMSRQAAAAASCFLLFFFFFFFFLFRVRRMPRSDRIILLLICVPSMHGCVHSPGPHWASRSVRSARTG